MFTEAEPPAIRRRPRDRKQQILVAARDLIVSKGYPSVTMAEIAEKVGITSAALYRHFSNKAVLLEEVMTANFRWLDEPLDQSSFDAAVEDAIARVVDQPYISDLWAHEVRFLSDDSRRELRARMLAWNRSLIEAVHLQRPELDLEQEELLAWAAGSLMSCIGRRAMHAPLQLCVEEVRSAMRALTSVTPVRSKLVTEVRRSRLVPAAMRERLILAAFEQFGERGYQETSMATLGAAADVSGPNLYSYFQSKADILRAVFERASHALWLDLDRALESSDTAQEALDKLTRSYVNVAGARASMLEDPNGEYEMEDAARITQREYIAEWVALLQEAMPPMARDVARVRVQLGLFLVSDLYRHWRLAHHEAFRDNLVSLVEAVLFNSDSSNHVANDRSQG